jgi:hypothetical protein
LVVFDHFYFQLTWMVLRLIRSLHLGYTQSICIMQVKQHSQFTCNFFFFQSTCNLVVACGKNLSFCFHCCKLEQKHCGFSMNFNLSIEKKKKTSREISFSLKALLCLTFLHFLPQWISFNSCFSPLFSWFVSRPLE